MINKKLLAMGLSVVLTTSATACLADPPPPAGLTLTGQGLPHQVIVKCNGIKAMYNIPRNGPIPIPLPWILVSYMFGGSQNLNCSFRLNNHNHMPQLLGRAQLTLTGTTGDISTPTDVNSDYAVNIDPGTNAAYTGISVTISPTQ